MPRWSAERRDVPIARDVKTPRKRLPRASQARNGCLASTPRLPALRSPFARRRGSRKGHYGAAGAAKQTAGGAMAMSDFHLVDTTAERRTRSSGVILNLGRPHDRFPEISARVLLNDELPAHLPSRRRFFHYRMSRLL